MAYETLSALPAPVRHVLPRPAQKIFLETFNSAWENYGHVDERAFRVAWSAVKRQYAKDPATGKWKSKAHSRADKTRRRSTKRH
jgi:cation transport regulator